MDAFAPFRTLLGILVYYHHQRNHPLGEYGRAVKDSANGKQRAVVEEAGRGFLAADLAMRDEGPRILNQTNVTVNTVGEVEALTAVVGLVPRPFTLTFVILREAVAGADDLGVEVMRQLLVNKGYTPVEGNVYAVPYPGQ